MWKSYFNNAKVYGIDIHDNKAIEEDRIFTYKGDQNDKEFLKSVAKDIGNINIIIDDGSHLGGHVVNTFNTLFPLLSYNGIYVIKDIESSYWPEKGGDSRNLNSVKTSMGYFKSLVDGLNYEEL